MAAGVPASDDVIGEECYSARQLALRFTPSVFLDYW